MRLKRFGLACLFLGAVTAVAQTAPPQSTDPQGTSSPAPPPASSQTQGGTTNQSASDKNQADDNSTSKDRLFFALPNFLTLENGAKAPPLTSGQKFKLVAKGAFDYVQIPWYAILASISQAENSAPGYGQGWEGYGKRVGSAAADGTIENFMVGAVLPSILHQDPRYYQMGKGGFLHRATYSATRILITRSDSGRKEFNFSEVFGSAIASGISTYSYHARTDRSVSDALSGWGTQIGYDTVTLMIREFWPDIRNKLKKKPAN